MNARTNKNKAQKTTKPQMKQGLQSSVTKAQAVAGKRFVAYYRVSTKRQGQSGLGLEAQKQTVEQFASYKGTIIAEYREVESGKKNDRPELVKAIAHAKEQGATLLIAKLDRLSRNASFVLTLRDSGADFIACDLPDANTLTIGIFASVAQFERERISQRIREALAVKKQQGVKLGGPKQWAKKVTGEVYTGTNLKGSQAVKQKALAETANRQAFLHIQELRQNGNTWRTIAGKLNKIGLKTVQGKAFQATTAMRVYNMFSAAALA